MLNFHQTSYIICMVMFMIKVVALDFVGVLVRENDCKLNEIESKIERLFGPNKSDEEFIFNIKKNIINTSEAKIINTTKHIISSIYDIKIPLERLLEFKTTHTDIKLVVATNHVSFVNDYILNTFKNVFDKIYISSNINQIKPTKEFYTTILQDLNIDSNEMLLLDDSLINVQGALECNIPSIHINKESNILEEIQNYL